MAEHDTFVSTLTTVLYATSVGTVSPSETIAGPAVSADNVTPLGQAFTAVVPISTVEVVTTVTVVTVTVSSVETSGTSESTPSPASPTPTQRE